MVRAVALKPWPVISSLPKPMRRKADSTPVFDRGRSSVSGFGKTQVPAPVSGCKSCRLAKAWGASGTTWSVLPGLQPAFHARGRHGTDSAVQVEFGPRGFAQLARAQEHHRRQRQGRTDGGRALIGVASIARSNSPGFNGSVTAARCSGMDS